MIQLNQFGGAFMSEMIGMSAYKNKNKSEQMPTTYEPQTRSKNNMIRLPRFTDKNYYQKNQLVAVDVECIDLFEYMHYFSQENIKKGGTKINKSALIQIVMHFVQNELQLEAQGFHTADDLLQELRKLSKLSR